MGAVLHVGMFCVTVFPLSLNKEMRFNEESILP